MKTVVSETRKKQNDTMKRLRLSLALLSALALCAASGLTAQASAVITDPPAIHADITKVIDTDSIAPPSFDFGLAAAQTARATQAFVDYFKPAPTSDFGISSGLSTITAGEYTAIATQATITGTIENAPATGTIGLFASTSTTTTLGLHDPPAFASTSPPK